MLETALQLTELERDVRINWVAQGDVDDDFEAELESIIRQDRIAQRGLETVFNAGLRIQCVTERAGSRKLGNLSSRSHARNV